MEGLKKVWNLKDEGKKDSSYSNVPIDHPDVESIRKIDEKDSGLEYNEKEKQMEAQGIESDKMYKSRRKAKRFVDYIQGSAARKRTATEGSFKKGGVTKAKDGKSIDNLLKPGEEPGEGYEGSPDMYPDYGEDRKDAKEAGKDKAYMQSRGYNEGGSVSRGVGKAIRGTKFKGVF